MPNVSRSSLTKDFYKPGDVAKMLGVNPRTVIGYDRSGEIQFERTVTGRRVISNNGLSSYLESKGLLVDDIGENKQDVIYARVSTHKHKERGDLGRQEDALKAYMADKNPRNLIVLSEVGSGLDDNRKQLLKLIRMILDGKVNRVCINHKGSLTRFGFNYIQSIADYHGVELVVVSKEVAGKSVQEELAEDLVSVIHSFSSKLYGMRREVLKQVEDGISALKVQVQLWDR
ncbi:MAG: IS607 family transposase [Eubacteriaceae bacterium]|nr:IS607 family transposase [Eubacteriaceae bacterium]